MRSLIQALHKQDELDKRLSNASVVTYRRHLKIGLSQNKVIMFLASELSS